MAYGTYTKDLKRLAGEGIRQRTMRAIAQCGKKMNRIAVEMAVDRAFVWQLAKGVRNLGVMNLLPFCAVVGCDLTWLLKGDEWDGQG